MTFRLVTGRGEHDHVTSDDYGTLYSKVLGCGRYKLDDITCSVIDANTVHISEGNLLIDGRHFRNSSEGTNLTIANGEQLKNRIDLVVCRYDFSSFGEDYLEHGTLAIIQGASTDGEPQVPEHTAGSIIDGGKLVEVPLFTIPITGISVGTPSACMLDDYSLYRWPLGSIYQSFDPTSPAELFGGTWEQITGVFLRADNNTEIGGSDFVTLIEANMAPHTHKFVGTAVKHTHTFAGIKFTHNHTFTGTAANHTHGFTGTKFTHNHTFTGTNAAHHHLASGAGTGSIPKTKYVVLQNLSVVPELKESLAWSGSSSVSSGSYAPWSTVNYDWGTAQFTENVSLTPAGTIGNRDITPAGTVGNQSITPAGTIGNKDITPSGANSEVTITPSGTNSTVGSGTPFDNRPAYQNVYMWKRVA